MTVIRSLFRGNQSPHQFGSFILLVYLTGRKHAKSAKNLGGSAKNIAGAVRNVNDRIAIEPDGARNNDIGG